MGVRNRGGMGFSYRPARLAELIPELHKRLKIRAQDCLDANLYRETFEDDIGTHVVSSIPVPAGRLDTPTLSRWRKRS
jgi:hypothetical protein